MPRRTLKRPLSGGARRAPRSSRATLASPRLAACGMTACRVHVVLAGPGLLRPHALRPQPASPAPRTLHPSPPPHLRPRHETALAPSPQCTLVPAPCLGRVPGPMHPRSRARWQSRPRPPQRAHRLRYYCSRHVELQRRGQKTARLAIAIGACCFPLPRARQRACHTKLNVSASLNRTLSFSGLHHKPPHGNADKVLVLETKPLKPERHG